MNGHIVIDGPIVVDGHIVIDGYHHSRNRYRREPTYNMAHSCMSAVALAAFVVAGFIWLTGMVQ